MVYVRLIFFTSILAVIIVGITFSAFYAFVELSEKGSCFATIKNLFAWNIHAEHTIHQIIRFFEACATRKWNGVDGCMYHAHKLYIVKWPKGWILINWPNMRRLE